jgi:hypothetical protein
MPAASFCYNQVVCPKLPCVVSQLRHVEDVDQGFANAIVSLIILLISCLTGFGGCVSFFSVSVSWTENRLIIK